jgi:hypothetical protein
VLLLLASADVGVVLYEVLKKRVVAAAAFAVAYPNRSQTGVLWPLCGSVDGGVGGLDACAALITGGGAKLAPRATISWVGE